MARVKISLPGQFSFSCNIPVRITDVNYGGHVGNDTILSIIHEARIQFLNSIGYTEMMFAGVGLIMADVMIEFKKEIFYGDTVKVSMAAEESSKVAIDIFYKLEKPDNKNSNGKNLLVAVAKTGMVCFDYNMKKIAGIPEEARAKLSGLNGIK